jgi:hypothetical protein
MVQNKFAVDDPYVLAQFLQAASSNRGDLNVILQEQDYLKATSAYYQQQGLTNNASNLVPNVTQVAQTTVGNGVSDGTISPDGEPVPPNRCPEVNQFVYIRDENGLLVPARAGDVTVGQFLYNPISDEFEEVINAEIVASELWEVITTEQCKFVGSPTTPLIQTLADVHGLALKDCHIGTKCLAMIDRQLKPTEVRTIVKRKATGFINHLSTDGPDKIYLAGTRADKVLFIHNKPPNDSLEA